MQFYNCWVFEQLFPFFAYSFVILFVFCCRFIHFVWNLCILAQYCVCFVLTVRTLNDCATSSAYTESTHWELFQQWIPMVETATCNYNLDHKLSIRECPPDSADRSSTWNFALEFFWMPQLLYLNPNIWFWRLFAQALASRGFPSYSYLHRNKLNPRLTFMCKVRALAIQNTYKKLVSWNWHRVWLIKTEN